MNILVTGNLGYVGSVLTPFIKNKAKKFKIHGCDLNYFSKDYEYKYRQKVYKSIDKQIYKDIGNLTKKDFKDIHTVIHLAAVSNDPIGNEFYKETKQVNFVNTKKIIYLSKSCGVKHFIFASSCSVYGFSNKICDERSKTNPLTNYSKSKIYAEKILKSLSDKNFKVTILRFATACGYSPFIRLDLVLNDFIASALFNKKIELLSSGDAIRPLISVDKMAKTIFWFTKNYSLKRANLLLFNVGSNKMNFSVKKLAEQVRFLFLKAKLDINKENVDKRSYRVSFSKFQKYTKNKIKEDGLKKIINYTKKRILLLDKIGINFRTSNYIRLNKMRKIIK